MFCKSCAKLQFHSVSRQNVKFITEQNNKFLIKIRLWEMPAVFILGTWLSVLMSIVGNVWSIRPSREGVANGEPGMGIWMPFSQPSQMQKCRLANIKAGLVYESDGDVTTIRCLSQW